MKTTLILLLLIATPASADEWRTKDTWLEAGYLALHTIDWLQTREIARNPDKFYEKNHSIGTHPSVERVDGYMAITALAHVGVAYILPADWRTGFQYITICREAYAVNNNFNLGIRIPF